MKYTFLILAYALNWQAWSQQKIAEISTPLDAGIQLLSLGDSALVTYEVRVKAKPHRMASWIIKGNVSEPFSIDDFKRADFLTAVRVGSRVCLYYVDEEANISQLKMAAIEGNQIVGRASDGIEIPDQLIGCFEDNHHLYVISYDKKRESLILRRIDESKITDTKEIPLPGTLPYFSKGNVEFIDAGIISGAQSGSSPLKLVREGGKLNISIDDPANEVTTFYRIQFRDFGVTTGRVEHQTIKNYSTFKSWSTYLSDGFLYKAGTGEDWVHLAVYDLDSENKKVLSKDFSQELLKNQSYVRDGEEHTVLKTKQFKTAGKAAILVSKNGDGKLVRIGTRQSGLANGTGFAGAPPLVAAMFVLIDMNSALRADAPGINKYFYVREQGNHQSVTFPPASNDLSSAQRADEFETTLKFAKRKFYVVSGSSLIAVYRASGKVTIVQY